MIRTQIYLTPKQHLLLKKKAASQNTSLSEKIREIIENELAGEGTTQNAGEWLLSMSKEADTLAQHGPEDLASNIDKYLYGEE